MAYTLTAMYSVQVHSPWPLQYKQEELNKMCLWFIKGKVKAIPVQAWTGPERSWGLRLPDFKRVGT